MQLSSILLLSLILVVSVGTAYAEEELTATVEKYIEPVTVEIEHPIGNWWCIKQVDGFVPVTTCIFQGVTEDGSDPVWNDTTEKWTTAEIIKQQFLDEAKILQEKQAEEDMTYWDKKKAQLDTRTGTGADLTRAALDQMVGALCYQGTGRAAATQSYDTWDIPTEMYLNPETGNWTQRIAQNFDIESVDLRGLYGKIQKAAQWCLGQAILERDILSEVDLVKGYWDQFNQVYHADLAEDVPEWSQLRVEEEANRQFKPTEIDKVVCEGHYSHLYKQDYGCEIEFDMNFPIPRGDGFIEDSDFYQAYLDFKNGDQEKHLKELIQKKRDAVNAKYR